MTDFKLDRINLKNQIETIKNAQKSAIMNNSVTELMNVLLITFLGSEEEKEKLDKALKEQKLNNIRAKENIEKGLLPFFNTFQEPISQEFGCPYCGEYCYPVNYIPSGSFCESECEFSGQTMIYCPKKKCRFELKCQTTMVPLGMILDDNNHYGYTKDESFTITYRNKIYTFTVKSEYLTAGMVSYFIREFIDYNLTRKEINEYVWLESVKDLESEKIK